MAKKLIILGAILSVLVPIMAHIRNVSWGDSSLSVALFPIFGLLAFTLLWLHAMSGVFEEWLRKQFDPPERPGSSGRAGFDAFIHWSTLVILISIVLHPLLLLIIAQFNVLAIFAPGEHQIALLLGLFGLILLLTYDVGKALKKHTFFSRNWNKILIISTIGFLLTFFHSLMLGSDLQTGFMRNLWIFYGVTAIAGTIYTYGIKRYLRLNSPPRGQS